MARRPSTATNPNPNGQEPPGIGELRRELRAASILLERIRLGDIASNSGYAFPDALSSTAFKRDIYKQLGYPRSLKAANYRDRYRREGIVRRVIDAPTQAMWSGVLFLQEDPDPEITTEFEQAVQDLNDRIGLWRKLRRADTLAALGQYAVLFIGAPGEVSGPLPRNLKPEDILYLVAVSESDATISKFEENEKDERFSLPAEYSIRMGGLAPSSKKVRTLSKNVHWSRVIHVAHGALGGEVYGEAALEAGWNYFDDLLKIVGGGAEASWKRADPGMLVKEPLLVDETGAPLEIDATDESDIVSQFEEFRHGLTRVLRTRGTEAEILDAAVATFSSNAATVLDLIAATYAIPKRILMGSERGEQASTQDRSNWADRIMELRTDRGEPMVRSLIDRLIAHGALPRADEGYEILWPAMAVLSQGERAELAATLASANKDQSSSGETILMTSDEIRDLVLELAPLSEVTTLRGAKLLRAAKQRSLLKSLEAASELSDTDSEEPGWRSVHRAADERFGVMTAVVLAFLLAASSMVDAELLGAVIATGDAGGALRTVESAVSAAEEEHLPAIRNAIEETVVAGGEAASRSARNRGSWLGGLALEVSFDAKDPRAIAWAEEHSASLVKEVGEGTREALRETIRRGLSEGIPPRALAESIKGQIGLLDRQVRAVSKLREELLLAKPGDLITRFPPGPLRDVPGFRVRIPKGGLTSAEIERRVAQYAAMQLNLRARTIARTEVLRAANEGQRQAWLQARDAGQLRAGQRRVWISTPDDRTRPEHADRDGVEVGIDEEWPWGTEPGQEPLCRCAQGLSSTNREISLPEPISPRNPTGGSDLPDAVAQSWIRDYRMINGTSRAGQINSEIQALQQSIVDAGFVPSGTTVYRGVNIAAGSDLAAALRVGGTFRDPGFMAVTTSRAVAQRFAAEAGSGQFVLFELVTGSGVHGAKVPSGLLEIVLERGVEIEILAVKESGDFLVVTGRILGRG